MMGLWSTLFGYRQDDQLLRKLTADLNLSANKLHKAIGSSLTVIYRKESMNPILQALADQVERTKTVEASAIALISGFAARVQSAVDAAIAGGATAEQLASVQAEVDALNTSATALGAAVAANP